MTTVLDILDDPRRLKAFLVASLDDVAASEEPPPAFRPAAVLVPVVPVRGRAHLLLTRRPDTMREHSGQVAFPGGKIDGGETPVAAALREAHEELGIDPAGVAVLGRFGGIPTITRYWVHPIVGWLDAPPPMDLDSREVAEAFYADLRTLLDPAIYRGSPVEVDGIRRVIHSFDYPHESGDTKVIWGATGRLLHHLFTRLFNWRSPPELDGMPSAS